MIINDSEFGEVIVRKNPLSKSVRFRCRLLVGSKCPSLNHTSDFLVKRFLNANRPSSAKNPLGSPETQRARDAKKKSS